MKTKTGEPLPNPGGDEAVKMGCTCPVLENCRGRGYTGMSDCFVFTLNCPVHMPLEGEEKV